MENTLFGMYRKLYLWMGTAILVGLVFGIVGIYLSVRHLEDITGALNRHTVALLFLQKNAFRLLLLTGQLHHHIIEPVNLQDIGSLNLYNRIAAYDRNFDLGGTDDDRLYRVKDIEIGKQAIYAVKCPLRLYDNNAPITTS